jgi:hypothetical protein
MAIRLMTEIMAVLPKFITSFIRIPDITSDPIMFLMKMFQLVPGTPVTFLLIISKHVPSYVAVVLVALFVVPSGASGTSLDVHGVVARARNV